MGEWGSGIKSIQRGTITISFNAVTNTATLSPAVDVSKTELRFLGNETGDSDIKKGLAYLALTNTTTVTATRNIIGMAGDTLTISWEIIEHY